MDVASDDDRTWQQHDPFIWKAAKGEIAFIRRFAHGSNVLWNQKHQQEHASWLPMDGKRKTLLNII